jgi:CRP/FNR family transcriptional regulator, cyclic AMP receptor protein
MDRDAGVCAELMPLGTVRSFTQGERIVRWGEDEHRILALESGICKVVNGTEDGREFLVAVRGAGDIVGELSALTGSARSASVVALSRVRAGVIDRAAFDRWLDGTPGAGRRLSAMLAGRIVESAEHGAGSHQRVDVRLADRILFVADHFPSSTAADRAHVPLTHDDYAAWVGATRAVITRAFGSLRDRKLIDFGRGWIQVLDRDGLEALGRDG